jgi:hypothetical protein
LAPLGAAFVRIAGTRVLRGRTNRVAVATRFQPLEADCCTVETTKNVTRGFDDMLFDDMLFDDKLFDDK